MVSPDLLDAVQLLRLKLRAAKGLIRDLTACSAEVERLLQQLQDNEQSPKEAELSGDNNDRHADRAAA